MEDVSADVARNVANLMAKKGWRRPELRRALENVTGEQWPDHKLRILDQSKPGVRSHISVDELLALCQAFPCTSYELLLNASAAPHLIRARSFSLFAEEVHFPVEKWIERRIESRDLRTRLQFHPEASKNTLNMWFAVWLANQKGNDVDVDDDLRLMAAIEVEDKAIENYSMSMTAQLNLLVGQFKNAPPSDKQVRLWVRQDRDRKAKAVAQFTQKKVDS